MPMNREMWEEGGEAENWVPIVLTTPAEIHPVLPPMQIAHDARISGNNALQVTDDPSTCHFLGLMLA